MPLNPPLLTFTASLLLGLMPLAAAETPTGPAATLPQAEPYVWRNMPMGGGGFFVQVLPHPTRPGELWVTSDVCGPFVRRADDQPFTNMAYSNPQLLNASGQGIFGIDIHPAQPDVIFVDASNVGLARSVDGGKTFEVVHEVTVFAKKEGPLVTIDPANPNVIYRGNGKNERYPSPGRTTSFRSLEGGAKGTWKELFNASEASDHAGYYIAIPPGSEQIDGRSKTVYLGVVGVGVHVSEDGGETFRLIPQPLPANARPPGQTVEVVADLLAHDDGELTRWKPVDSWMRDALRLDAAAPRPEIIVDQKGKSAQYPIDIPADVVALTLSAEFKVEPGLQVGGKPHETVQATIDFLVDGQRVSPSYKQKLLLTAAMTGWTRIETTLEVPPGVTGAFVVVGSKAPAGGGRIAGLTLRGTTGTPRALKANPTGIKQLATGPDGTLFIAHDSGLVAYHPQRGWQDLTPAVGKGTRAIAVHPKNRDWLLTVVGFDLYRSRNGGATWEGPFTDKDADTLRKGEHAPWFFYPANAAGCWVVFDPHDASGRRAWLSDAYMVWQSNDIWAEIPTLDAQWRGLENTAITDLAVPSRSAGHDTVLVASGADIRGVRFHSTTEPPLTTIGREADGSSNRDLGMKGADMSSVATCESDPLRFYGANNIHWEGPSYASRSDDGGKTWRAIANPIPGEKNHGGAKIAVACNDPDKVVYMPGMELIARYSHDGGQTWHPVEGLPWMSNQRRNFHYSRLVVADKVAPDTFYVLSDRRENPELSISRDAGKTWSTTGARFTTSRNYNAYGLNLATMPGKAGHLAVSLDHDGVWISRDFGATFTRVELFVGGDHCAIDYGAPAPGSDLATLYIVNYVAGEKERSFWRSPDNGQSWVRLSDGSYFADRLRVLAADRERFGVIYFAEGGRGVLIAHPRAAPSPR